MLDRSNDRATVRARNVVNVAHHNDGSIWQTVMLQFNESWLTSKKRAPSCARRRTKSTRTRQNKREHMCRREERRAKINNNKSRRNQNVSLTINLWLRLKELDKLHGSWSFQNEFYSYSCQFHKVVKFEGTEENCAGLIRQSYHRQWWPSSGSVRLGTVWLPLMHGSSMRRNALETIIAI